METPSLLHAGHAPSVFRGSSAVLEQALLAQACRVVLAACALADQRTRSPPSAANESVTPHIWRAHVAAGAEPSTASGTTMMTSSSIYRVDHVLNALGVRQDAFSLENSKSLHRSVLPGDTQDDTQNEVRLADFPTRLATSSTPHSAAEAALCLAQSPRCAILTALHALLCPAHPLNYCQHGDGTLVRAAQACLARPATAKAAARVLAECALSRWRDGQEDRAEARGGYPAASSVELVDLATRTDGAVGTAQISSAFSTLPVVRVVVPDVLELVFPELCAQTSASSTTLTTPVHCGCSHVWFRACVPRWLLEASQDEHAVVWCETRQLRCALRRWRRRRGLRLLAHLTRELESQSGDMDGVLGDITPLNMGDWNRQGRSLLSPRDDTGGGTMTRADAKPEAGQTSPQRARSQCSSISGRSLTSVPSLPSHGVEMADVPAAPVTAAAEATLATSPTRRAQTQSPLRADLIDDDVADTNTNTESSTPHTPAAALLAQRDLATLDGLVCSPQVCEPPPPSDALTDCSGADEVEAACLRRLHLLRRSFRYWRDGRYYARLATQYLLKKSEETRRRAGWEVWRRRLQLRQERQREAHLDRVCEAHLAAQGEAVLARSLYVWRDAAAVRLFQWGHVGERAFQRWQRATTLRHVLRDKAQHFHDVEAPALVANCFHVWTRRWQRARADRFRAQRQAHAVVARLRARVALSSSSAPVRQHANARDRQILRKALTTWQLKARDHDLVRRYADLHTLRLYRSVMLHWQREKQLRETTRAYHAMSAEAVSRACLRRWSARLQQARDAREYTSEQAHERCRALFVHWQQRSRWRQKRREDLEEVADTLAPSLQLRTVLRYWFARMTQRRVETEAAAVRTLNHAADSRHRFHLLARSFFRWKAKSYLLERCAIDARQALPRAAVLPSFARPARLFTVPPNQNTNAASTSAKAMKQKRKAATVTVTTAQSEQQQEQHQHVTVTCASRFDAERRFHLAQRQGRLPFSATRLFVAETGHPSPRLATSASGTPVLIPSASASVSVETGSPSRTPSMSMPSAVSFIPASPVKSQASMRVVGRELPVAHAARVPDGLNESHVSPRSPPSHVKKAVSSLSSGWATRPRSGATPIAHITVKPQGPPSSRAVPHYMKATVASSATSATITPEKQRTRQRSGAAQEVAEDGLPTPIAADSLMLATSFTSEGLATW